MTPDELQAELLKIPEFRRIFEAFAAEAEAILRKMGDKTGHRHRGTRAWARRYAHKP